MMMNCSRAAERWFASDSTHQFLPKHFDGREGGKWAEGEEGHHFEEGKGKQRSYVGREGEVNNWRSLVASHSGVKSVSDAPVEPSSC